MQAQPNILQQDQVGALTEFAALAVPNLKELFTSIKKCFIANTEDEAVLIQTNEIIAMLIDSPSNGLKLDEEQVKFMYGEFLPGVAKRVVGAKFTKEGFLKLIVQTIEGLINLLNVELRAKTPTLDDLVDACRVLFDPTQKYYTSHNQKPVEEESTANQSSATPTESMSQPVDLSHLTAEDRIWRNTIKVGDLLDAVKHDENFNVRGWARAKIEEIRSSGRGCDAPGNLGDEQGYGVKTFRISYVQDISVPARLIRAHEPTIAPYLSKTHKDTWREALYKGQEVDAMSRSNSWFKATVIEPDPREECVQKFAKIGFRQYSQYGDKSDEMGKYFGFTANLDEHIGQFSLRIQPPNTYTNPMATSELLPTEKNPAQQPTSSASTTSTATSSTTQPVSKLDKKQDEQDMLEIDAEQIKFVTERKTYRNEDLTRILNHFGEQGGFANMIKVIQNPESSIELLFYLIDCIGKISILLHKSFIDSYLEKLQTAVLQKVINATEVQIRSMKQHRMEELVNTLWDKIMARIYDRTETSIQKNIFNFEIGALFLRQTFLERRIDGARIIDSICRNALINKTLTTTTPDGKMMSLAQLLLHQLQKHDILGMYYSKRNVHSQLIQRSASVLKVLMSDSMNQEQLDMIWTSVDQFDDMKFEFYAILKDIASAVSPTILYFYLKKISQIAATQLKAVEIELISQLISQQKKEDAASKVNLACGLEFFWEYLHGQNKITDTGLIRKAILCFSDIIKHADVDIATLYLSKITEQLIQDKNPYIQIKILLNYFNDFVSVNAAFGQAPSVKTDAPSEDGKPAELEEIKTVMSPKSDLINFVNREFGLSGMLFDELKRYVARAKAKIAPLIQAVPEGNENNEVPKLTESTVVDLLSHNLELDARLKLIHYIAVHSETRLTKENLTLVWDELITNNPAFGDHQIVYKWLRGIIDDCLKNKLGLIDEHELIDFFKTKIADESDEAQFKNLSMEGYYCIQSFFLLINLKSRKLYILGDEEQDIPRKSEGTATSAGTQAEYAQQATQKFTSYSNTHGAQTISYSFNKNTQSTGTSATTTTAQQASGATQTDSELLDVVIRAAPQELEGIRGLWRIAIDCNDQKVNENAARLLLQLHTNVAFELKSRISEFENQFTTSCIAFIQRNMQLIQSRDPDEQTALNARYKEVGAFSYQKVLPIQEKRIQRCLKYIKMLIHNSEKDGLRGCRPHSCLRPAEKLTLNIINMYKTGQQYRQRFQIWVNSNATIFELKKVIAYQLSFYQKSDGTFDQEIMPHPCSFRINRASSQNITIKDTENGTTLEDMNFRQGETFTILPRAYNHTSKYPLLNDEKTDLNARAIDIFTQIFNEYAISDEASPEDGKYMSNVQIANFVKGSTGENCDLTDSRIFIILEFDSNKDGKLTLTDFLEFYRNSCIVQGNLSTVRNNLRNHGFRQDLQMAPKPGQDDNILQLRPTIHDMPRFKLQQNQMFFNMLFQLLAYQSEVSKEAQRMFKMLNTNLEKFWTLLWLDQVPQTLNISFSWDRLFKPDNVHETSYVLEILESFLVNDYLMLDANTDERKLREMWVANFIRLGGFVELVKLCDNAINIAEDATQLQVPGIEVNAIKKSYLERLLRIISVFVMGAFHAQKSEAEAANLTTLKRNQSQQTSDPKTAAKHDDDAYKSPEKSGVPFVNAANSYESGAVYGPHLPGASGGVDASEITQEYIFGTGSTEQQQKEAEDPKAVNKEQSEPADKKEALFFDSSMFKLIVKQIREFAMSDDVFQSLDFAKLQQQLLSIVAYIISRNQDYSREDAEITKSAMDLWIVAIISSPSIKTAFFSWTKEADPVVLGQPTEIIKNGKPVKQRPPVVITNTAELILAGLFTNKGQAVRKKFQESLELLCERVTDGENNERPLFWCLNLLIDKSPVWDGSDDTKHMCKDSQEFFTAVKNLLLQYKEEFTPKDEKVVEGHQHIDFEVLLVSCIENMKRHKSMEGSGVFILEDKTMSGYMMLMKELLTIFIETNSYEKFLALGEKTDLLHELFWENLFYLPEKTRYPDNVKCQHKDSRVHAFKLLYRYCRTLKPKEMCHFLNDYLWYFIKDVQRPKEWRHTPQDKQRKDFCGIKNLGNICYMNSMLQQFYMVPQFRYQLLRADDGKPTEQEEVTYRSNKYKIDDNLLHQLQKLFAQLETSTKCYIDPTEFCYSYKDFEGNPTNTAIQCDAQEFLNFFFDKLENILAPTSQKYLCQDIFQGRKIKQRICKSCGYTTTQPDDFYTLSLTVKNKTDVYDSLKSMLAGDEISDYTCSGCNKKVDLQSIELLGDTPNVLIIHLQRICFSFETFANVKINTSFEFPKILDLKDYTFGEAMKKLGKTEADFEDQKLKRLLSYSDDDFTYRLVGVNIHRGTGEHGHYWSLINTQRGQNEKDPSDPEWLQVDKCPWKEFNDETVSFFNVNNLSVEAVGGDRSALKDEEMVAFQSDTSGNYGKSAYMLVYERKNKKQIREVVNASEAEPKVDLIEYGKIEKYVEANLMKQILKDNADFIADKQLFSSQFFMLIKLMMQSIVNDNCMSEHNFSIDYKNEGHFVKMKQLALQVSSKVMFDFLCHYFENATMQPICDSMCSVMTFSDSYVNFATSKEPSILVEFIRQTYLADDCQYFFDVMFNCVDQSARNWIGTLTANTLNKAMRIYGICSEETGQAENAKVIELGATINDFMTRCVLKLQERDCQKQWNHLKQYFDFLCSFGKGGKYQTMWLLSKFDIVADLIDFMLGSRSPRAATEKEKRISMGGSANMPQYGPLVKLVSHLVRCQSTQIMIDNPDAKPETFALFKDERNNDAAKTRLPRQFCLSQEAFNLLTNTEFLDMAMKNQMESEELARALAHVQYGDKVFSKTLCGFLLKSIVNTDYNKISGYLDVVEEIVQVQENFGDKPSNLQRKRLEWIFGVPKMNVYEQTDRIRIGLDALFHNIKSEVCEYRSYLTFEPKDNDCLLHLLWRYQGRMDTYTLTALEYLLAIANAEDTLSEYFAQLPPVTYQYARYTDWIKPYLQNQLAKANAGYGNAIYAGQKELIVKVLSLYETFEAFLKSKNSVEASNQAAPLTEADGTKRKLDFVEESMNDASEPKQPAAEKTESKAGNTEEIIPNKPPALLILKTVDETYLGQILSENDEQVYLNVSHLSCNFVQSEPNGWVNKSVPDSFLNKYNINSKAQELPKVHGTSAAAMLKEREAQLGIESKEEAPVIRDGNEQWANVNNVDPGNMADDENNDDKGYKQDSEGSPANTHAEKPQELQEQAQLDDSFEKWEGASIESCADLVYKFALRNTTDSPIHFRIKLKPKQHDTPINLYWPATGIRGSLVPQESAIVGLLPKLTPDGETGRELEKLDIKLTWKVDDAKMALLKTSQNKQAERIENNKASNNQKKAVQFAESVNTVAYADPIGPNMPGVGTDSGVQADFGAYGDYNPNDFAGIGDEKPCGACTFLNPMSATRCSVCETPF